MSAEHEHGRPAGGSEQSEPAWVTRESAGDAGAGSAAESASAPPPADTAPSDQAAGSGTSGDGSPAEQPATEAPNAEPPGGAPPGAEPPATQQAPAFERHRRAESPNMLPARETRRSGLERLLVRLIATAGIIGIGVAIAAIMVSSKSQGWLVGLVVAIVSVALSAILWSSRQL